jgi:RNA polymerase sigma-70 factor (ECF subfamily)
VTSENSERLTGSGLTGAEIEALYAEYSHELRAFLRGVLRDTELAADALQMTFVKVLEAGHTADRATFKGWLFKVALNEALGLKRKQQREKRLKHQPVWETRDSDLTAEEKAIRAESVEALRQAIRTLPEEQRQILELRLTEELMTFADIAEELHLPLGTVLTRMRLAMKKLTAALRERDS